MRRFHRAYVGHRACSATAFLPLSAEPSCIPVITVKPFYSTPCENNPVTKPDFAIAIMASGKGTRLKSKRPKPLHEIGRKPLLLHIIAAASQIAAPENIYT